MEPDLRGRKSAGHHQGGASGRFQTLELVLLSTAKIARGQLGYTRTGSAVPALWAGLSQLFGLGIHQRGGRLPAQGLRSHRQRLSRQSQAILRKFLDRSRLDRREAPGYGGERQAGRSVMMATIRAAPCGAASRSHTLRSTLVLVSRDRPAWAIGCQGQHNKRKCSWRNREW